jgi:asparagine synthase (glutamine-hydrolysing)
MLESLAAHGSDGCKLWPDNPTFGTREPVALGHRLLKITAQDELEAQPLAEPAYHPRNPDTAGATIWLVADARIDNRADLAAEFGLSSSEANAMPDSQFVLCAWQRWGEDCVQHLVGSFAFAVWDNRAERFFLARDHAGDRPLFYRKTADYFAFATTARAIRICPGVSSELDERQLARDLIGLPPEYPSTRFRDVRQLAPGHCLTVTRAGAVDRRYWKIDALAPVRFARDEDYVEAFLEIFDEAVRCRLRTTGAIAAELSAGLDSGSVAATAAHLLAPSGILLTAYTAVPCPGYSGTVHPRLIADEGPYAAEVAALYPNMVHHRIDATGSNMLSELARVFPLLDIPHGAALNNIWGNLILDHAAASGAKVMLCGALGNFAFSYSGDELLRNTFRSGRWLTTLRQAWQLRQGGLSSGRNAASLTFFGVLPWALRRRIDPLIRNMNVDWSAIAQDRSREFDALDQFRRHVFTSKTSLPHLMEKAFPMNQYGDYNAATGAGWGIEVRDPTADKRVFEFCAAIPQEQFVVGGEGRSLARRAMRGRLPEAALRRKQKGTQSADWFESLSRIRGELAQELTLQEQSPGVRRLLDLRRLRGAIDNWPQTVQGAVRDDDLYQSVIPRGMAVGYFIRRVEEEAAEKSHGAGLVT